MKRLDKIVSLVTVGAVVCAVALPAIAGAATPVRNLTLAKNGDFTEITLPVPSSQLCDHFTEPATAARPFRIVLNICNAEHALTQQHFVNLPPCVVQKIRTSQFAPNPEPVVRVVLDLTKSATYTVRAEADRLVIAIADASPAFAAWNANADAPILAQAVAPTKTETPAVEKPKVNPPTAAPSAPVETKPAQSLTAEPVLTQNEPVNNAPVTAADLAGPNAATATAATDVTPNTDAPAPSFSLPSQPLVLAPEYLSAAREAETAMKQPESATAPVNPDNNAPPMLAATNDPLANLGLPPENTTTDTATTQEALIDRLKAKFFSNNRAPKPYLTEEGILIEQLQNMDSAVYGPPTPGTEIDREALLERIRLASQHPGIPANMLPSVPGGPARVEVFYDDLGRRDPFEPLLKGLRSGFISEALPSVETLRMVGVLKDEERAMALMEDTEGHSYIMRPGDPVENGRVLSVGEMRTVIQVDEYGWTRTVVLQLSPRGADPSKALGANSWGPDETETVTPTPAAPATTAPAPTTPQPQGN
ncbi:MAG TPA: AMIN domain-containing protein [bacterium]|nr:AMIN domain-containing protein [bacterium]